MKKISTLFLYSISFMAIPLMADLDLEDVQTETMPVENMDELDNTDCYQGSFSENDYHGDHHEEHGN